MAKQDPFNDRNYFTLRINKGVQDVVNIKQFEIKQCNHPIQKDGCNCGIIALKVCDN